MRTEIIGRDPVLTYRITQLIGERAKRDMIRRRRIDALKSPLKTIINLLKK
jgi:hypothetical protein